MRNPFHRLHPRFRDHQYVLVVPTADIDTDELAHRGHQNSTALVAIFAGETEPWHAATELVYGLPLHELRVTATALAINLHRALELIEPENARGLLQDWALDMEASRYQ